MDVNDNIEHEIEHEHEHKDDNRFSQDDLIPIFSHLFIEYKNLNKYIISSRTLWNKCREIIKEGEMFPHISEKYNHKKHSQIIRNYTSNRTFEKYGMAEYNPKTKEYVIF